VEVLNGSAPMVEDPVPPHSMLTNFMFRALEDPVFERGVEILQSVGCRIRRI
jgi:hypothetical protein